MSIPEQQLETWSNQGAITTSKITHERIRGIIQSNPLIALLGRAFIIC